MIEAMPDADKIYEPETKGAFKILLLGIFIVLIGGHGACSGWKLMHNGDNFHQMRGSYDFLMGGLSCTVGSLLTIGKILGFFRNAPQLALYPQKLVYRGLCGTYSADWKSLASFEMTSGGVFSAKIIGDGISKNLRGKKKLAVFPSLKTDKLALCNELNRRIAEMQGMAFVSSERDFHKENMDFLKLKSKIVRQRMWLKLGILAVYACMLICLQINLGAALKPYGLLILLSALVVVIVSRVAANKKYPLPNKEKAQF